MKSHKTMSSLLTAAAIALLLSACSSSDNNDNTPVVLGDSDSPPDNSATPANDTSGSGNDNPGSGEVTARVVQFDATAGGFRATPDDPKNKYTYLNLDSGEVIELTDAEAELSTDWHLAFKRTKPKLNGGDLGPGNVKAALADAQEDFYADGKPDNNVFMNATADNELVSLDAATFSDDLKFEPDSNTPEIIGDGGDGSWFSYDPQTHSISANPDAWNIVRGAAADSFAKMHVTEIDQAAREITVEMYIQGKGETAFDVNPVSFTAALGEAGGSTCFDFDTKSEVDCASAVSDWDIQVEVAGRDWNIWTNGGIRGAAGGKGGRFGTVGAETIANYPDDGAVPRFFADSPSGVLLDSKTRWYAYSLAGNNKIWPNYRVYIIDTGTNKYKLQVLKYYNDVGTSGHITVRYSAL